MKPIKIGEPILDTLRPVDFAWQAFQAGMRFANPVIDDFRPIEITHAKFVEWWNSHPQVKP